MNKVTWLTETEEEMINYNPKTKLVTDIVVYEVQDKAAVSIQRASGKHKHYKNERDVNRLLAIFNSHKYKISIDTGITSGCLIVRVENK